MADTDDHLDFSDLGPCVPGDAEWHRRVELCMAQPIDGWWWLSFVDTDRSDPPDKQVPGGGGFLGICIVPAGNMGQAAIVAGMLGCNPGGQVSGQPFPTGWTPRPEYRCVLFTGADAMKVADLDGPELCEPPS